MWCWWWFRSLVVTRVVVVVVEVVEVLVMVVNDVCFLVKWRNRKTKHDVQCGDGGSRAGVLERVEQPRAVLTQQRIELLSKGSDRGADYRKVMWLG